jgi:SlyX protein
MRNGEQALAERVEALEIRSAYQEDALEQLNRTVTEQWALIERLRRELGELSERLEDAVSGPGPADRPPPHY